MEFALFSYGPVSQNFLDCLYHFQTVLMDVSVLFQVNYTYQSYCDVFGDVNLALISVFVERVSRVRML